MVISPQAPMLEDRDGWKDTWEDASFQPSNTEIKTPMQLGKVYSEYFDNDLIMP